MGARLSLGRNAVRDEPSSDLQLVSVAEDEFSTEKQDIEIEEVEENTEDNEKREENEEGENEEQEEHVNAENEEHVNAENEEHVNAENEEQEDNINSGNEQQDEGEDNKSDKQEEDEDEKSHATNEVIHFDNEGGERQSYYERSSIARTIMDCGTCFSKYILCFFNFIILIAGIGVLFLGVWLYSDKDSLINFARTLDENTLSELNQYVEGEMASYISYILMAIGGAMFILSILGYCGALRESRCLLGFYGFLLVLILILEVTAAGLAFVYKDRAESEVRTFLIDTIQKNYDPASNNTQKVFFDHIMAELKCCGVDDYTDFNGSESFRISGLKVPRACCIYKDRAIVDPDCPKNPSVTNSYYMQGCYQRIMSLIKENMNIVIYVAIGLICIELLSTFLAFCLCKTLQPYDK